MYKTSGISWPDGLAGARPSIFKCTGRRPGNVAMGQESSISPPMTRVHALPSSRRNSNSGATRGAPANIGIDAKQSFDLPHVQRLPDPPRLGRDPTA
jgi:hypothetical protein